MRTETGGAASVAEVERRMERLFHIDPRGVWNTFFRAPWAGLWAGIAAVATPEKLKQRVFAMNIRDAYLRRYGNMNNADIDGTTLIRCREIQESLHILIGLENGKSIEEMTSNNETNR